MSLHFITIKIVTEDPMAEQPLRFSIRKAGFDISEYIEEGEE